MTQKKTLENTIDEIIEAPRDFPVIEITNKETIEDLFKDNKRGLLLLCYKYKKQMNIEKAYWTLFDDYSLFITKQHFNCGDAMKEKKVILQIVKFGGRFFVRCPLVVKPTTTIRRFG